ncbi:RNA polymerase sigma factor [Olivibacter sitiensis]|uniref:RNA polymerase sigma factor n=1 Tax=Olivibacter sitiensis TaxID=376470 RepID=UPI0003F6C4C7|nr:sigma-70 family RNA polymerase sigma factor [Olivibacter sitiensis]
MDKLRAINEQDATQLLKLLRVGDTKAFEAIVQDHTDRLFQHAVSLLKDRDDAEDLVQDVFMELWQRREKIKIDLSLSAYLHSMLKYRFLRHVSRASLHADAMAHLLRRMDQMQESILDVMAASDLQQTLSEAIDRLPENMRRVFVLRNEDYSLKEIAQVMGLAEQTVKGYHSELNRRIKDTVLARHPDISHTLIAVVIARLIEN